jgi:hypothetical protein
MAKGSCPHCGFKYAWDSEYCGHCRRQRPGRRHWEAFAELAAFRPYLGPSARRMAWFAAGCGRRAWHLVTLPYIRGAFDAAEQFAAGVSDLDDLGLAVGDLAAMPEPDRRGFASPAAYRACHGIWQAAQHFTAEHPATAHLLEQVARVLAAALAQARLPDRDWWEHELPPELEPFRAALVPQDDPRTRTGPASGRQLQLAREHLWRSHSEYRRRQRAVASAEEAALCDLVRDIYSYPFDPVRFDPGWRTATAVALARHMDGSRDFSAMPILADALQDAGCEEPDVLDHCRADKPHTRGCWVVEWVLDRSDG